MDDFYVAYLTGNAGTSALVFVVLEGRLVGANVGGLKYDGTVQRKPTPGASGRSSSQT
jgi:hypothetical protein